MSVKLPKYIYLLVLFLLLFVLAKVLDSFSRAESSEEILIKKLEQKVSNRIVDMDRLLETFDLGNYKSHKDIWQKIDSLSNYNISVLVFQGKELVAWNSHKLPVDGVPLNYLKRRLVKLDNGWYVTSYLEKSNISVIAFSLLKTIYNYENSFLQSEFSDLIDLDKNVKISQYVEPSDAVIKDAKGRFVFGLQFIDSYVSINNTQKFSAFFYVLSLIILWAFLFRYLKSNRKLKEVNWLLLISYFILYVYIYYLFWINSTVIALLPTVFSPSLFAYSSLLASLGHFMIFSLAFLNFAYWWYLFYQIPNKLQSIETTIGKVALSVLLQIMSIAMLVLLTNAIYILVEHSTGKVLITKIVDVEGFSFLRIVIIVLIVFAKILFLDKIFRYNLKILSRKLLLFLAFIIAIVFSVIYGGIGIGKSDITFLFYIIIAVSFIYVGRDESFIIKRRSYLWLSVYFGLFVGAVLLGASIEKEESNRELLVDNLAFQLSRDEDLVAETYLVELENQLANDITLSRILGNNDVDFDAIYNHLTKFYFYGYWNRYDMQIIPCFPGGDVYIESHDRVENCYAYFYNLLELRGYQVPGSKHFYYLNENDGNVSFFGVFRFFSAIANNEISLFIELHSKPLFEGLGYPELLTSSREQARNHLLKEYSYAKYVDDKLVKRSGDYNYKPDLDIYKSVLREKVFVKEGDYSHLIYKINHDFAVILSKKDYSINDIFIFFSVLFLTFLFVGSISFYIYRWYKSGFHFQLSIQKKIQVTFVSLMLVLLFIVAVGTIYYIINQFENKHLELLENKVQSILSELEYKVGYDGPETYIPEEYLNYQLQMLSNVFYCDINLFGIDGKLIGTSRPEIYINGLSGTQMNSEVYYKLFYTETERFIAQENIGKMSFVSLYVPFLNSNNELSGFVNLPYFVGKSELDDEISSVVVTIINFYLIFSFIVIGLAVFLAGQITRPLLMLQNKISKVRIGGINEEIDYKKRDEIGELVTEYNRMVNELAISAEKLARSERDLAWREMAKQIAHEIKNPLTPMKLNIQYLTKAWDEKSEDFDTHLKRASASLIEQINSLSSIASEFSKFAQMPTSKSEYVNLIEKIENITNLYISQDNVDISVVNSADEVVTVQFDGEQLVSVFNNLVKNAIQAGAKGEIVKIDITIQWADENVRISVSDNGRGIPQELEEKLFTPSFTTKTGGMGLGLAIVNRIVENAGGKIWYERKVDEQGALFIIELPYINPLPLH